MASGSQTWGLRRNNGANMSKGKSLDSNTIRQIAKMLLNNFSNTEIAQRVSVSRITIGNIKAKLFTHADINLSTLDTIDDATLIKLIYPSSICVMTRGDYPSYAKIVTKATLPNFDEIIADHIETHRNIQFYYFDYVDHCLLNKLVAVSRSTFYKSFKERLDSIKEATADPIFTVDKDYGRSCEIDYIGTKYQLTMLDGTKAIYYVFTITWSASGYTFCYFVQHQSTIDSCNAISAAFKHFGCTCFEIVPDNARCWVDDHSDRTEPIINQSFNDFMEQFDVFVTPANYRSPRQKAHVEYANRLVKERVLPRIDTSSPLSLEKYNFILQQKVDELINKAPLNGDKLRTREYLFLNYEKPAASTLVSPIPEFAYVSQVKVPKDYHVTIDAKKYSVPFTYIGYVITVKKYANSIVMYCNNNIIASHSICDDSEVRHTLTEHMPTNHIYQAKSRKYKTPEDIFNKAQELNSHLLEYCKWKFNRRNGNPFKACIAAINFYISARNKTAINKTFEIIMTQAQFSSRNFTMIKEIYSSNVMKAMNEKSQSFFENNDLSGADNKGEEVMLPSDNNQGYVDENGVLRTSVFNIKEAK